MRDILFYPKITLMMNFISELNGNLSVNDKLFGLESADLTVYFYLLGICVFVYEMMIH